MDLGSLKEKVGPLPKWAWAAIILALGWYLYHRSQAAGSSSSVPGSGVASGIDTSTGGTGTAAGAPPASGAGSAADNLNSDLISSLAGSLVNVNSSLVSGLMSTTSSIEGLGQTALEQEGQIAQAVIYSQAASSGAQHTTPSAPAPSQPSASTPPPTQVKTLVYTTLDKVVPPSAHTTNQTLNWQGHGF